MRRSNTNSYEYFWYNFLHDDGSKVDGRAGKERLNVMIARVSGLFNMINIYEDMHQFME